MHLSPPNNDRERKFPSDNNGSSILFEKDYENLIYDLLESGEISDALQKAREATSLYSFSSDLKKCLYSALLKSNDYDGALEVIRDALILSPGDTDFLLDKTLILIKSKSYSAAQSLIEELKNNEDSSVRIHASIMQASLLEATGDLEGSFEILSNALRSDQENSLLVEKIWITTEILGNYENSILLYTELLNDNPYNYLLWYNLGHAYSCIEEYSSAAHCYEYSFLINEDFEYGYREYADILILEEKYDKALKILHDIKGKFNNDAELNVNIGQCYFFMGANEKAREYLSEAKDIDALNDKIYFLMGLCDLAEKRYEDASYHFTIAIELESKKEEYYEALATAYSNNKEYELAEVTLTEAIDMAPENWHLRYALAKLFVKRLDYKKALAILDEAQEVYNGIELEYCRSFCLLNMGDGAFGKKLLKKLLVEDYNAHQILFDFNRQKEAKSNLTSLIEQLGF